MDTDVLIVGAGPTGLMLANQLVRRGVKVIIVDRNPGPSVQSKALGVQARTLEIYAHLGIAEQAVTLGRRASGASIWIKGRRVARVPLGDIGADMSPYPYLLILGQDENEKLLGEALRAQGVAVLWNTRLVDLVHLPDGVRAKLDQENETTIEITARWVAGCDGAHSTVRSACNIAFTGAPYQHMFYVADTRATGSMAPGELNVYLWQGGFHLFFPMRGNDHWRVVGIVPAAQRSRDQLVFGDIAPFIRTEVNAADNVAGLAFQSCTWFSTYHVHHRRAERFRDRRCFLLGDAAHIHSPVGAQGMNTGLQDAYNLAWKLALVVTGQADEALLDSYETERIPVADRLLRTTDRAFTFLISPHWLARFFRMQVFQKVIAFAMRYARTRMLAFRTISQIGIRYANSPLSRMLAHIPKGAPAAGDRFPWLHLKFSSAGPAEDLFRKLDDTRFTLLLFGQALPGAGLPDGSSRLMSAYSIPDDPTNDRALAAARILKPSFYLLRPDGHIGLAGSALDGTALSSYFNDRVKIRTGSTGRDHWNEMAPNLRQ
jgi:2-polyprenyl-6-methoxyphenol hydroxylase-like FAD-dependent oxidoreductase